MSDTRATKTELRNGALLAVALLLAMVGCTSKQSDNTDPTTDPFAPPVQDHAPDPLREAHERGWLWAQRTDAKLITDCGAIADEDERFGCGTYVNNRTE